MRQNTKFLAAALLAGRTHSRAPTPSPTGTSARRRDHGRSQARHAARRARDGDRADRCATRPCDAADARCAHGVARRRRGRRQPRDALEAAARAAGHRSSRATRRRSRRSPTARPKAAGIAAGEKAAAAVLAARADDGAGAPEHYRPHAAAGAYVPTAVPAVPHWAQRKPWLMASAAQFRPGAAARAHQRRLGARLQRGQGARRQGSTQRTPSRPRSRASGSTRCRRSTTACVRSVAAQPGPRRRAERAPLRRRRAGDGRRADRRLRRQVPLQLLAPGHRDPQRRQRRQRRHRARCRWTPLIDAPMHPEYPSGHAFLAGAVGAVLQADVGSGATPVLASSSPTAKGATRRWTRWTSSCRKCREARVYEGIHYRTSSTRRRDGPEIGELAVKRVLISRPD